MRHATPTRSAHRATPALQLRLPFHGRRRARRHLWREPYPTAHLLTRGLAALIVLGIFVMLGVLIVAEDRHTPARTLASAEVDARIAARTVDTAPLTADEVFPTGAAGFRVTRASLTADCPAAATGALRQTLARYGCSQAVQAALTVPYADYRITAGMLNLPDATSATAVGDQVRSLVETGDGGFAEMSGAATGPGTPVLWRTRGHFVMYCLITGPSGELVPAGTPQVQQITADILDTHLHDTVLVRRAG
ncbi:hypothetical protein [Actinoplanes utahensis]|uniref:Uncharacterized protein n=1 Tax=Actinoplanes utahensis TaxID=1869 RepID=A0A0A6UHF8_ACTUT|nr:hypothetical protein [Actinoplanes utahensis]KHD73749.1 hypothetical protein MB27_32355 [Actinoplanes utahensis]GIF27892.1 hypothetical protein Aut01nite_08780 [Actinoplanes utahensis]